MSGTVAQYLCSSSNNSFHGIIPKLNKNTTIWEALTPCIVYSFVQIPLAIFGLLTLLIVGIIVRWSPSQSLCLKNKKTRLKLIFHLLSLAASSLFALLELFAINDTFDREHHVHLICDIIFNICTCISYFICLRYGSITSAALHFSWALRSTLSLPLIFHLFDLAFLNGSPNVLSIFLFLFAFIEFISAFSLTLLLWFPDVRQTSYERLDEKPPCPNTTHSAAQLMCFSYVFKFLLKSHKQTVTYDDYWQLDKKNQIGYIREFLKGEYPKTRIGLIWLMFQCSWYNMAMSFLHGIFIAVLRFVNCFSIVMILDVCTGDYPLWLMLFAGFLPVIVEVIRIIYRQKYFFSGRLAFCNFSAAFNSMIFDKMLKLSPKVQTQTAVGVIMNHVTVDLVRARIFWSYMKDFIVCPAIITVSMIILANVIGLRGTLYGTSVLVGFMLINVLMSRYSVKFFKAQMNFKDDRLKLLNDVLNGIRVLKLYGWEVPIQGMVSIIRKREIREMQKAVFFNSFIDGSFALGPIMATVATFYGYIIIDGGKLTPKVAFLTLFLYDTVRVSINFLPQLCICTVTALVSLKRLLNFLNQEERPMEKNIHAAINGNMLNNDVVASISDASFSWTDKQDEINLHNINLKVRKGQLVGVIGSVGAGKSTLLQALVGELQPINGDFELISNRLAYVSQQAWIQNLTLRKNILFDSELDNLYYERVLDACALRPDIQLLKAGDLTEIGEKGINLSGGQKARISLARAVYHRSDFYAIDDPFSAVDSHVAEHLFNEVIGSNGLLSGQTRVVALNSTKFLPYFDWIICLSEGKITHSGTFEQLSADLSSPIASHFNKSSTSKFEKTSTETSLSDKGNDEIANKKEADKLVQEENLSYGRVSNSIYLDYFKAYGLWNFAFLTPLIFLITTAMNTTSNLFLAKWSSAPSNPSNSTVLASFKNLEIYAFLGLGGSGFYFVAFVLLYYGAYNASRIFHKKMAQSVIRAKMSFFDQTPIGRIMNRFSTDMETLDSTMGQVVGASFMMVEELAYSLTGIFIALPWVIPTLIPLGASFIFLVRFFNAATSQFRRMATSAVSEVCSTIQDAYSGASSIRCYNASKRFQRQLAEKLDRVTECNFVEQAVSSWIRTILCLISNLAMFTFIMVGICMSNEQLISLGLLALIVNSSFTLNNIFGSIAEIYRMAETEIVCVERIKEYIGIESEGVWSMENKPNQLKTIQSGKIEFRGISLRYREEDDPVLHQLSFCVEAGERIGIIGRTGAGKTSITSVLFRLVEPFEGEILIDGVDIKRFGTNLRRILTIIPQDPVLFCGSLKKNLDPFDEYKDDQIWDALDKANLLDFAKGLTNGLEYEISDSGSNLSVGQRQLICLARALLRTSSILILDEATSSVDYETDRLIQETIRKNFANCTILTIAHRLETIMDYNKVLVMEAGRLQEFDTIPNLLLDENSLFYGFAKKSGLID